MGSKKPAVYGNGLIEFRLAGTIVHRTNGPAAIYPRGTVRFIKYGLLHRTDGPAIIYASGAKKYYVKGVPCEPMEYFAVYGVM